MFKKILKAIVRFPENPIAMYILSVGGLVYSGYALGVNSQLHELMDLADENRDFKYTIHTNGDKQYQLAVHKID